MLKLISAFVLLKLSDCVHIEHDHHDHHHPHHNHHGHDDHYEDVEKYYQYGYQVDDHYTGNSG